MELVAVVKLSARRLAIPKDVIQQLGWKNSIKLKLLIDTENNRLIVEPTKKE